jgi:hypothetical protein
LINRDVHSHRATGLPPHYVQHSCARGWWLRRKVDLKTPLEDVGHRLAIDEKKEILGTLIDAKRNILAKEHARSPRQLLLDTHDSNGCAGPLRRSR